MQNATCNIGFILLSCHDGPVLRIQSSVASLNHRFFIHLENYTASFTHCPFLCSQSYSTSLTSCLFLCSQCYTLLLLPSPLFTEFQPLLFLPTAPSSVHKVISIASLTYCPVLCPQLYILLLPTALSIHKSPTTCSLCTQAYRLVQYAAVKSVQKKNLLDSVTNVLLDLTIRVIQFGRFIYFVHTTFSCRKVTDYVFCDGSL